MFAVIYTFEVYPNKDAIFIEGWRNLTQLIYQYEGSLGSRLHKKVMVLYIAYAQWPDRKTWENSGSKLPEEAKEHRKKMKEACVSISTQHELLMIEDLLAKNPF